MLRVAIFFSRFISPWKLHTCRDYCAMHCLQNTLQRCMLNKVRYFCQGETQAPGFDEHLDNRARFDEHLDNRSRFQASTFITERNKDALRKVEARRPFRTKLQGCVSPCDLLDLVEGFTLTHRHVSHSLMTMWSMTKKMSSEQRCCELKLISEHPGFEQLGHSARMQAPYMDPADLAYTLQAANKLGVSQRSLVVQTLLRVVQERLNQFDEDSLSILYTCLEEMESDKNTDALKQGLKLLLEDRIPTIQNVTLLRATICLFGKDAPPVTKRKLEAKALLMAEDFTLPDAQNMLTTLATMHLNSKPLLDICSKKIAANVSSIPFIRLLEGLKCCRELKYRNLLLFSSISDHLANTLIMLSNKQVILSLLEFEGRGYRPVTLLDAFAERVIQKPDGLTLRDILAILKVYSSLNHNLKGHQQKFLVCVSRMLESCLPKMSSTDLLKATSCLSILGHFPQAPLEELLQEKHLEELQRGGPPPTGVEQKLHILGRCLRLDGPALPPTFAPLPDLHGDLFPDQRSRSSHLLSALKGLVGEDALQVSVIVEGVYFIDYVITLSPEANDVCSPSEQCSRTSEKTRRIAVLCTPPSSFCFGTTHPRSSLAAKIRHLKILGYEPVLVPILGSHADQENIMVLRNLIFPHQES